jgi:hypothetical protein
MRVAALYDIHGMPWALEAVLAEVDADAIVFGGDFFGGPYDAETVELVRSVAAICIRGNAEELEVAAFWTLVEDGEPSFRRTPFDIERAENLLVAASRDEAIAYIEGKRT